MRDKLRKYEKNNCIYNKLMIPRIRPQNLVEFVIIGTMTYKSLETLYMQK